MDLYWREAVVCPTEEGYIRMVIYKTGGLFRLALEIMQVQSNSTTYEPHGIIVQKAVLT